MINRESSEPPSHAGSQGVSPVTVLCKACGWHIDSQDQFCRHCGRRQTTSTAWVRIWRWYYHPVAILLLAFLVLGPFALPLVWLSPRMSRKEKMIMAAVICVYSFFVIYYTCRLIVMIVRLWSQVVDPFAAYR